MVIWIVLLVMTAAAVMAVLWPLSRHESAAAGDDPNTEFYRQQIAEIERDRARGMLMPEEAESAKAEAARRLIRAGASADAAAYAVGEPALRRRRAVSALALSLVPILAVAVYGAYGSPHLPVARPAPQAKAADGIDLAAAVGQIEAHLAKSPEDGKGWDIIAPVYLRMGRVNDAVNAYATALRLLGRDANRLTNYGEALVLAQSGIVTAQAKAAFDEAIKLDGSSPRARFYLAQAAAQDGQTDKARAEYTSLLASAPANAPWVPVVKDQLARLDGTAPAQDSPMPDAAAIQGMVDGLASRLASQGGSAEEWTRLMRSYMVLGQRDKAQDAARRARQALAKDGAGLQMVDAMAQDLQLTDDATKP
ncbi:c-type cytochrome biogenesis protein CcmI [Microvirga pudoricolor]|uniref:c-type cytochrome biogenesis protein CcmI n=1 Tax=Microvirga pudoricolor TaxID=2778729 RepID=UPI00194E4D33|nr:c-type cytochrome biogenesis protein CcmI [Microvirga pudoricolor]MBM6592361.1 c-type cytochrome biogenesis protein CcmI [Microvirga pudoricolor]